MMADADASQHQNLCPHVSYPGLDVHAFTARYSLVNEKSNAQFEKKSAWNSGSLLRVD